MAKLRQFSNGARKVKSPTVGGLDAGTRKRMTGTNGKWLTRESKLARTAEALQTKRATANSFATTQRGFKASAGKISPAKSGGIQKSLDSNVSNLRFETRLNSRGRSAK